MGGVVALVVLVALGVFAFARVVKSWRTTGRVWGDPDGDGETDGEGEAR